MQSCLTWYDREIRQNELEKYLSSKEKQQLRNSILKKPEEYDNHSDEDFQEKQNRTINNSKNYFNQNHYNRSHSRKSAAADRVRFNDDENDKNFGENKMVISRGKFINTYRYADYDQNENEDRSKLNSFDQEKQVFDEWSNKMLTNKKLNNTANIYTFNNCTLVNNVVASPAKGQQFERKVLASQGNYLNNKYIPNEYNDDQTYSKHRDLKSNLKDKHIIANKNHNYGEDAITKNELLNMLEKELKNRTTKSYDTSNIHSRQQENLYDPIPINVKNERYISKENHSSKYDKEKDSNLNVIKRESRQLRSNNFTRAKSASGFRQMVSKENKSYIEDFDDVTFDKKDDYFQKGEMKRASTAYAREPRGAQQTRNTATQLNGLKDNRYLNVHNGIKMDNVDETRDTEYKLLMQKYMAGKDEYKLHLGLQM